MITFPRQRAQTVRPLLLLLPNLRHSCKNSHKTQKSKARRQPQQKRHPVHLILLPTLRLPLPQTRSRLFVLKMIIPQEVTKVNLSQNQMTQKQMRPRR